jgi:hypothetical protein
LDTYRSDIFSHIRFIFVFISSCRLVSHRHEPVESAAVGFLSAYPFTQVWETDFQSLIRLSLVIWQQLCISWLIIG